MIEKRIKERIENKRMMDNLFVCLVINKSSIYRYKM